MGLAINLSSSRGKRCLKSEALRLQNLWVEEFNNLLFLKIISDTENKSISMQNLWPRGGAWLDHTVHVQPVHYIVLVWGW